MKVSPNIIQKNISHSLSISSLYSLFLSSFQPYDLEVTALVEFSICLNKTLDDCIWGSTCIGKVGMHRLEKKK